MCYNAPLSPWCQARIPRPGFGTPFAVYHLNLVSLYLYAEYVYTHYCPSIYINPKKYTFVYVIMCFHLFLFVLSIFLLYICYALKSFYVVLSVDWIGFGFTPSHTG